jgi:hypothetical protein
MTDTGQGRVCLTLTHISKGWRVQVLRREGAEEEGASPHAVARHMLSGEGYIGLCGYPELPLVPCPASQNTTSGTEMGTIPATLLMWIVPQAISLSVPQHRRTVDTVEDVDIQETNPSMYDAVAWPVEAGQNAVLVGTKHGYRQDERGTFFLQALTGRHVSQLHLA